MTVEKLVSILEESYDGATVYIGTADEAGELCAVQLLQIHLQEKDTHLVILTGSDEIVNLAKKGP